MRRRRCDQRGRLAGLAGPSVSVDRWIRVGMTWIEFNPGVSSRPRALERQYAGEPQFLRVSASRSVYGKCRCEQHFGIMNAALRHGRVKAFSCLKDTAWSLVLGTKGRVEELPPQKILEIQ